MNHGRRTAAWVMAAILVFALLPGNARAEEAAGEEGLPVEDTGAAWQLEGKESALPVQQPEQPEVPEAEAGPRLYFGLLHSHTADSSGTGTPAEAYAYAAETGGLDFLAVTDHSASFDGAAEAALGEDACAVSSIWQQGREAAVRATNDAFLALYGFEMDWQNGLGHIGTYFTPGFQSWEQEPFSKPAQALEAYYSLLNTVPGAVGQFNHPDIYYGDFEGFGHYSEKADAGTGGRLACGAHRQPEQSQWTLGRCRQLQNRGIRRFPDGAGLFRCSAKSPGLCYLGQRPGNHVHT